MLTAHFSPTATHSACWWHSPAFTCWGRFLSAAIDKQICMSGNRHQVIRKLSAWVNQQILKNSFAISITVFKAHFFRSLTRSLSLSVSLSHLSASLSVCQSVSLSVCSSINNALWKYCGNNIINNNNAWQAPRKAFACALRRQGVFPAAFLSFSPFLSPSLPAFPLHFALASSGLGQHYVC